MDLILPSCLFIFRREFQMKHFNLTLFLKAFFLISITALGISAQYTSTDFVISSCGTGSLAVYNSSLVFQNNLATSLGCTSGLDLLANGNIVSTSTNTSTVRFYNPSGTLLGSFTNSNVGTPLDIKAQLLSNVYIAANSAGAGISDFTTAGSFVRTLGATIYSGVAILPGNVLWAGHNSSTNIDVYNLVTGTLTTTIPLDGGQTSATSMYYSPSSNTVLMTDFNNGRVYERTTTGVFVREFMGGSAQFGVTRGPGGDVFATDCFNNRVFRWNSTATLLSTTVLAPNATCPQNIIWAGNIVITAANVSISGRVFTPNGRGLPNATVFLTNQAGDVKTARTNMLGYYRFEGIESGGTYTANVLSKVYQFTPQIITVNDDLTNLNFTAQEP